MKTPTNRNVSPKLSDAVKKRKKKRLGISMTNGLEDLAGGWSDEDFHEFEKNTADQRTIDPEIWD